MSDEALRQENEKLREENQQLHRTVLGLRFAAHTPDLEDAYQRRKAALAAEPAPGMRVKIISEGKKYNHKDFAETFKPQTTQFTDSVAAGTYGTVLAVAPHFKREDTMVYLVKLDAPQNGCAVMARGGVEVALWEGAHVTVSSVGSKYASKDFRQLFPRYNLVDDCRVGKEGVILESRPHYKVLTTVHLVAIDAKLNCVVMNGKGLIPREVPGLKEFAAKKEKEEAEAAAATAEPEAKEEGDAEGEAGEKRAASPAEEEPEAKRAKTEE